MDNAFRALSARPAFTATAIATLAIGFGFNAAIFSVTRTVPLRPLPYRDADCLVRVFETSPTLGRPSAPVAPINYAAWRGRVDAFDQTTTFRRVSFNVSTKTDATQVEGFSPSDGVARRNICGSGAVGCRGLRRDGVSRRCAIARNRHSRGARREFRRRRVAHQEKMRQGCAVLGALSLIDAISLPTTSLSALSPRIQRTTATMSLSQSM